MAKPLTNKTVPTNGWVRLVDAPRYGIHAGQVVMVVGQTDTFDPAYRRWAALMGLPIPFASRHTVFVLECEDEHAIYAPASDLRAGEEDR